MNTGRREKENQMNRLNQKGCTKKSRKQRCAKTEAAAREDATPAERRFRYKAEQKRLNSKLTLTVREWEYFKRFTSTLQAENTRLWQYNRKLLAERGAIIQRSISLRLLSLRPAASFLGIGRDSLLRLVSEKKIRPDQIIGRGDDRRYYFHPKTLHQIKLRYDFVRNNRGIVFMVRKTESNLHAVV